MVWAGCGPTFRSTREHTARRTNGSTKRESWNRGMKNWPWWWPPARWAPEAIENCSSTPGRSPGGRLGQDSRGRPNSKGDLWPRSERCGRHSILATNGAGPEGDLQNLRGYRAALRQRGTLVISFQVARYAGLALGARAYDVQLERGQMAPWPAQEVPERSGIIDGIAQIADAVSLAARCKRTLPRRAQSVRDLCGPRGLHSTNIGGA